ncbi:MAG: formylglycine-generating enzyme family protein [Thiotrichales bacterium]
MPEHGLDDGYGLPDLPFVSELDVASRLELQRLAACEAGREIQFHDLLRDGSAAPPLGVIPAGTFEMGASEREFGYQPDEGPRLYISITRAFAIGRTTVTAEQFARYQHATGWRPRSDLVWARGELPVINVTLGDAERYAAWLSAETGAHYRLPSEAEWEYAARAGSDTPFSLGALVSCREVHFNAMFPYENAGGKRRWLLPRCMPRPRAIAVGTLPPNPWGLHEVHGNVWEFTISPWSRNHLGSRRDGRPNTHHSRWVVTKGGSWFDPAARARSAARSPRLRDELDVNLGFRLVRELG